ncbi:DUF6392 family protein [Pseudomonas rubra]|uniref:DUF6392 family protein n=1 Tax=Pseudomonas rubra TaxID=2942627 RepID=A0ABT5PD97_9PSED|nr:DUF6392 family protein [Pseudomonas rubra]MDD1016161.1 DUF6392 family protein [Pseudomonas rubra]MDD1039916.1 DUF6392 family protein [Pseudomonas rubra]MDD1156215.1 DUF6392 family protein [Pseudomonas rubra]
MIKLTVHDWIARLGTHRDELVDQGILPDRPLDYLFYGHDTLSVVVEPGLELGFSASPEVLTCVHVTLLSTLPNELPYGDKLPGRLQDVLTQKAAGNMLGAPYRSQPAVRMPLPLGETGGWDAFIYNGTRSPSVSVMLQYTNDFNVCDMAFFQGKVNLQRTSN